MSGMQGPERSPGRSLPLRERDAPDPASSGRRPRDDEPFDTPSDGTRRGAASTARKTRDLVASPEPPRALEARSH